MKLPKSCVAPEGTFKTGIHEPCFHIRNFRENDFITDLGEVFQNGSVPNTVNFPSGDVSEKKADIIYEISNPYDFNGTTYINSAWADKNALNPELISLKPRGGISFQNSMKQWLRKDAVPAGIYDALPRPVLLAVAESSTDPEELVKIAEKACSFCFNPDDRTPCGLLFEQDLSGNAVPKIHDPELFDIIANNRFLPDSHKEAMVLKPGIQGPSEITGEYLSSDGH
ncbi:MAG: hypothetical protein R6V41_07880, partial [Desulfobacteraceae bacterium]